MKNQLKQFKIDFKYIFLCVFNYAYIHGQTYIFPTHIFGQLLYYYKVLERRLA